MKKSFFLLTFIATAILMNAQSDKIAILPIVDRDMQVDYNTKLMLRSYLSEAVTQTNNHEAYDGSNLGEAIDEYEFQRTGNLSTENIRKVGLNMEAQKLLITEISQIKSHKVFITVKLYNASTANMEKTANITIKTDMSSLRKGANLLIANILTVPSSSENISDEQEKQLSEREQELTPVAKEAPAPEPKSSENYIIIERISKDEYKMGDQWLTRKEYYELVNNRDLCIPAYQQFQKGLKLEKYGKWTMVAGGGVLLVGTLVTAIGIPVNEHRNWQRYDDCEAAGATLMSVGGAAVITGGTLWIVGVHKKDYAYEAYNDHCAEKISFNLIYSGNGLGLAINF